MDPASIVGLAAAGLQFASFTAKVAMGSWRAVSTARNVYLEASDLHTAAERFSETVKEMDRLLADSNRIDNGQLSAMEQILYGICIDYRDKAEQLRTATVALADKLRNGSRIFSLWAALQQQLGTSPIEKLTASLTEGQRELLNATVACLWEDSKENKATFIAMRSQLTSLQEAITELTEPDGLSMSQRDLWNAPTRVSTSDPMFRVQADLGHIPWFDKNLRIVQAEIMEAMADESWNPGPLDDAQVASPVYRRVVRDMIQWLKFDAMGKRQNDIPGPFKSTMEWIWLRDPRPQTSGLPESTWSSFPKWLQDENGSLYWITGKPGSGKSTMMRYIEEHHNLRPLLEYWSSGLPLQILSFYAWNPGADTEKSLEGLLRTILAQGLHELPNLLPVVLPRRWGFMTTMWGSSYPLEWAREDIGELEESLYRFLHESRSRIRLLILIDGLDEFEMAPKRLIETIERISHAGNLKLCVASRPWNDFKDSFTDFPHLAMDRLTAGDIKIFTNQRFKEALASQDRLSEVEHLCAEVQQQAEGVFQWVVVVVNFLIDMLKEGDSLHTLLQVVNSLPQKLSDLYSTIWSRISQRLRQQAEDIFALKFASSSTGLHFLTLWAVNERETANTDLSRGMAKNTQHIKNIVSRSLNSRTLGLLEINSDGLVNYLHRTVFEWISKKAILKSALTQPDHAILHGLCVLGPYISMSSDTATTLWKETILFNIMFHTERIALDTTLARAKPDQVVSWLGQLEKKLQPQISVYPTLAYRFNERHTYRSNEGYTLIQAGSLVELVAVCGFGPFIQFRLDQDRSLANSDLFFFCL
ncbi:hypothetical protein CC79DRAFT_1394150 [Sarocladium strictum]